MPRIAPGQVPVIALVHNEANPLTAFFAHYRDICDPVFLLVYNGSDDGSAAIMRTQADVHVFQPKPGSVCAKDRAALRQEVLDRYCADRWEHVPDIDELFVWLGKEFGLSQLIFALKHEGAEAVFTLMIGMYADALWGERVYERTDALKQAYP